MATTIRDLTPKFIRYAVRRVRLEFREMRHELRERRRFPYRVRLNSLVAEGCEFEITTPVEAARVRGLNMEEDLLPLLLAEIQPGDVLFDVGSCVGLYAIHSALRGARVVAFEPDPSYRKRLIRNIDINKLHNSIDVIEWAVSDQEGRATLYTDGVEGRSPSLRLIGKRGAVLVKTNSIDNAVLQGRLPLPTLVKLDIEGAEILALRGMTELLRSGNGPRCVTVELHPDFLPGFQSSVDECVELMEHAGYVKQFWRPRGDQVHCVFKKIEQLRD